MNILPKRKAVFLDRDGVINVKLNERYVTSANEFTFIPGSIQALKMLRDAGYLLILITNQRGIARGIMSEDDLAGVHAYMQGELEKNGVKFDSIHYCPHENHEACLCRKPQPGMILNALEKYPICRELSYMVGDSASDIAAGKCAHLTTVRIAVDKDIQADLTFPDLLSFAHFIYSKEENA